MKNIIEELGYFKPKQKKNFVEIKLPVVIRLYNSCLVLRIIPIKNGYAISDDGNSFYEFNESTKYYFDLFMQNDKNYHYEIQLHNDVIFKKYEENFNINVAINEFIRFYIDLDNYIMDNNIT